MVAAYAQVDAAVETPAGFDARHRAFADERGIDHIGFERVAAARYPDATPQTRVPLRVVSLAGFFEFVGIQPWRGLLKSGEIPALRGASDLPQLKLPRRFAIGSQHKPGIGGDNDNAVGNLRG